MVEKPYGNTRLLFPDHLWKQQQVIIMNPQGIVFLESLKDLLRIQSVDFYIGFPGDFTVGDMVGEIVKQRPEGIA